MVLNTKYYVAGQIVMLPLENRRYWGYDKCNAFWSFGLLRDLKKFVSELRIWEYTLC